MLSPDLLSPEEAGTVTLMNAKLTSRQRDKLIEAAQNAITFVVTGRSAFPIDMFRYDRCWPATEADSVALVSSASIRTITLKGLKEPSLARWASFGWKVLDR